MDDDEALFSSENVRPKVQETVDLPNDDDEDAMFGGGEVATPVNQTPTAKSEKSDEVAVLSTLEPAVNAMSLNQDDICKQLSADEQFLNCATICIKETETQMEENVTGVGGSFVVYLVEVRPKDGNTKISYSSCWRRFSEFDQLRDYFVATYQHVIIPVIRTLVKS